MPAQSPASLPATPYPGFAFLTAQPYVLPLEGVTVRVRGRRAVPVPTEEAVILQYLAHYGGQVEAGVLGWALGFALRDEFVSKPYAYCDPAEVALWEELLQQLVEFGLIRYADGVVTATAFSALAVQQRVKYQYFEADCCCWQFARLTAPLEFSFLDFGYRADLSAEQTVDHPEQVEEYTALPVNRQLATVRWQLGAAGLTQDVELLEVLTEQSGRQRYPQAGRIVATGYCYRPEGIPELMDAPDYRLTASVDEQASPALTTVVNAPANLVVRQAWGHAAEFTFCWQDPAARFTTRQLRRFWADWDRTSLLVDSRLTWDEPALLPALLELAGHSHRAALTAAVPVPLAQARLEEFSEHWDWSVLSSRLEADFVTRHLTDMRDEELRYPWDFGVLSQREPAVVEQWLTLLLREGWAEQLGSGETFAWNWPLLAERLSEQFLLAHLATLPFSRQVLLARGPAFLEAALGAELAAGQPGAWDRQHLLAKLPLPFLWQHLAQLAGYLPWHGLLARLLAADQPALATEELSGLRELIRERRDDINPLTVQSLAWSEEWVAFFDELGLLHWPSSPGKPGFEQHPALTWSPTYFTRYHDRVRTPQGAAFVSGQVTDLGCVAQYPNFAWDWAELSGNRHLTWTKELTSRYRERLVWSRLLRRYGPEDVSGRLPTLHAQLAATRPEALPDLWRYANEQLPVAVLLGWADTYADYLDRALLSRRDPAAVAAYLLREADFRTNWDWAALAQQTPPDLLAPLVGKADVSYRQTGATHLESFSRLAAARLPLTVSLQLASTLALPWDWDYVSTHLTAEQLGLHLPQLAAHVNWTLLLQQEAVRRPLADIWVLYSYVQPYLPWQQITPLLRADLVEANLNDLAGYLDWHFLARQPNFRSLLLTQLLDHPVVRERLPWEYVLGEVVTPADLAADLPAWTQRLRALTASALRAEAFAAFTRRVPVAAVLSLGSARQDYPSVPPPVLARLPLDWEVLSADPRLAHQLSIDLLVRYRAFWHWPTLSRNELLNGSEEYLLHSELRSAWDWLWLSQHGQFINAQLSALELTDTLWRFASVLDWPLLSLRTDVRWRTRLLREHRSRPWNWAALSASPALWIDDETLQQLQAKPWNWAALSANPAPRLSLTTVAGLAAKPWDWAALANNRSLTMEPTALEQLAGYPWDWAALTRHPHLTWTADLLCVLADYPLDWAWLSVAGRLEWTADLLERMQQYLNWQQFSRQPPLPLTARLLRQFRERWDFAALTRSPALTDLPTPAKGPRPDTQPVCSLVCTTRELPWAWPQLSARTDITFTQAVLDELRSVLHWPTLSRRAWGREFLAGWLDRYAGCWDLVALAVHAQLPEAAQREVRQRIESDTSRSLPYLCRLERMAARYPEWAGYAFHCTHLTNAAAIIQSGQLLCRQAVLQTAHRLADASGSINYHPSHTWDYARLYYRPQTFTQFYTEQLGLDRALAHSGDNRDIYHRAEELGFPKCPIPVFFRFKIAEILATQPERFFVSDGNMQRRSVSYDTLKTMERRLTIDKTLFHQKQDGRLSEEDWAKHKDVSQQEILLKHHLALVPLSTIDIFVVDNWAAEELTKLIGTAHPLAANIRVVSGAFRGSNRQLDCYYSETCAEVTTDFTDEYDIVLESENLNLADLSAMNAGTFRRQGNQLIADQELRVSWPSAASFRVRFRDKVTSRPGGPRDYDLFQQATSAAD
ncbi:MAG: DarT ssDNA thymidine ADP-ribosyltransferase family protein [Janthinobacterium lividum]